MMESTNPEATTDNKTSQIHAECLNALTKDVGINIKALMHAIARDSDIVFDEEEAKDAAASGETIYRNAILAGSSLSCAEIKAFKAAIPNKEWGSEETWKMTIQDDINQALNDYCATGTCKRFVV